MTTKTELKAITALKERYEALAWARDSLFGAEKYWREAEHYGQEAAEMATAVGHEMWEAALKTAGYAVVCDVICFIEQMDDAHIFENEVEEEDKAA